MFGGGWGLEGGGSSQEFDITTQIPESSSRSRSGSGGNTPRRTQKQPSRTETVPARDTVVQKRKPFGSPASPKVRSPKNTPQPSTSTSTSVVAETHSENDITKNNDVNKGRERGVFHASNSSDVLFKRSAQAAAGAGVSADPLKKYQKKDIIGGVGNHNDNDNGDDDDSNSNEDIQKRSIEKKNADSGEDSPSTGEHSVAENSSETKWNDEDFALSVSVRTNDIPLKGYTVQRNGNSNDENGKDNGKKIDGEIGGEGGGGVEADKKSDKGSEQEGDGIKEGEEGVGAGAGGAGGEVGGLKSLRDDSQTVHKYVTALSLLFS